MALNKIKAIGVPRNLGSKQNNSQKKKLLLFPGLQETVKTPVVLELMKIIQQYLRERRRGKRMAKGKGKAEA